MSEKIIYGIKKRTLRKKDSKRRRSVSFAAPVAIPGAYELTCTARETGKVFADNITM